MMNEREKLVRHLGKQLVAVADVAVELAEIGDLENARREAELGVHRAREALFMVSETLEERRKDLASLEDASEVARQTGRSILAAAEAKGKEITVVAKINAADVIGKVKHEANALRDRIRGDREAHAAFMDDVGHQHEQAQEALDKINLELRVLREKIGA